MTNRIELVAGEAYPYRAFDLLGWKCFGHELDPEQARDLCRSARIEDWFPQQVVESGLGIYYGPTRNGIEPIVAYATAVLREVNTNREIGPATPEEIHKCAGEERGVTVTRGMACTVDYDDI